MSMLRLKLTSGDVTFSITPGDEERWTRVSFQVAPKIGTVLIEDLARATSLDGYPVKATYETAAVECRVNTDGVFQAAGVTYKMPVHFLYNEDGQIELRGGRSGAEKKKLG